MEDRTRLLKHVRGQTSTHTCPQCQSPAYCAMEAGKSANLCWCMTEERVSKPEGPDVGSACLCRTCLTTGH